MKPVAEGVWDGLVKCRSVRLKEQKKDLKTKKGEKKDRKEDTGTTQLIG